MQYKLNSHILHRSKRSHPEVTIESGKIQCNKKNLSKESTTEIAIPDFKMS